MKITIKQLKQLIKEQVEENKPPLTADIVISLINDLIYEAYEQGEHDGNAEYGESSGLYLGSDRTRLEEMIKSLFAK